MLVIFAVLSHDFLPAVSLYLAGFRCIVSEFGAIATYLHRRFGRRSFFITLLRDVLNIITLGIVIWYGAVIALGVRQSGENMDIAFCVSMWYNIIKANGGVCCIADNCNIIMRSRYE